MGFAGPNLRFEPVGRLKLRISPVRTSGSSQLGFVITSESRSTPTEPVHPEPAHPERAGSNLYCEPAPPVFSAEVPVRTCTANRLHRFAGLCFEQLLVGKLIIGIGLVVRKDHRCLVVDLEPP